MSNPNPPFAAPRWFAWAGMFLLLAYGGFLARNTTVAAGGSDSSGYLNSARLLASGHLATQVRLPPELGAPEKLFRPDFQPLGFRATGESSILVPTYPTGLPLHLALAGKLFGWELGPLLVSLAAALGSTVLCYATARQLGLDWRLSAAGAVMLAVCPVLLFTSIQPLSDTLATTWCLAAVFAALRARPSPAAGREWPGWPAACGAAYGMAVLVRPTNLVLLPALLILLGLRWRVLATFVFGGLPLAAWLACYNHALYGGVFRSGYPPFKDTFDLAVAAPTARHFLHWLAIFLPGVMLGLPFAALLRREFRTRELLALVLWGGAITAIYLVYAVSQESWVGLRFILPAIPALILAGLMGAEALVVSLPAARAPILRGLFASGLAAWAAVASWRWSPAHAVFHTRLYEDAYAAAGAAVRERLPANALVVCSQTSGAVAFYTEFPVLRWDHVDRATFTSHAAAGTRNGLPIYALLFAYEEEDALRQRCPGNWKRMAALGSINLWRLDPPSAPVDRK